MMGIVERCLFLLGLFSVREQADGQLVNVARRGIASQCSTNSPNSADRAIDGGKDFITSSSTCASTVWETEAWFLLDLQAVYTVNRVVVTYRDDSFPGYLTQYYMYFGNSMQNGGYNNPKCTPTQRDQASSSITYSCGDRDGQYIMVRAWWINLAVCEIEVYETGDHTQPVSPTTFSDVLLPLSNVESSSRTFLRLTLNASADLTNATLTEQVLQKLSSALAARGITNVTLIWTQTPEEEKVIEKPLENNSC